MSTYKIHPLADSESLADPLTDEERKAYEEHEDAISVHYETFVEIGERCWTSGVADFTEKNSQHLKITVRTAGGCPVNEPAN